MNTVFLIGRLARDPELSGSTTAVCKMTLAVDRPAKQGEERKADFIRVTTFGRQAETCSRYLAKGRQAAVQGRIQTGSYQNKDGQTVYTTDVIADRVEFLGSRSDHQQAAAPEQARVREPEQIGMSEYVTDIPAAFAAVDDEIPF